MLTAVPWPELAATARRIASVGCSGRWLCRGIEGVKSVPVRCYASPNFDFATLVAVERDLPRLLVQSDRLQICSGEDETLLLNFRPCSKTILDRWPNGTLFLHRAFDYHLGGGCAESSPVLICGVVESVELRIPSHDIDVLAQLRRRPVESAELVFGRN